METTIRVKVLGFIIMSTTGSRQGLPLLLGEGIIKKQAQECRTLTCLDGLYAYWYKYY